MQSCCSPSSKLSLPLLPPMASTTTTADPQDARLIFVGDPVRSASPGSGVGASNAIRTTKYSLLTFVPRNLFEQFRRVAYIYFLALALLNQIPQLTVFGRQAAFVPLGTVLVLTAIKDAYEDYQRHRSDTAENNRLAAVLPLHRPQATATVKKKWKEVRVGELVRVEANETLPCDMVLLATSDPTGAAYVQTINLDGESNLKTRYAKVQTATLDPEALAGAILRCEPPDLNIYGFQATIELGDGPRIPLGPTNIVLRGCEIKNTSWAVGVAVYTGMETKVMLNNSGAPSKRSRLETRMNREIIVLAVIMIVLCSVIAICTVTWLHSNRDKLDTLPFYRRMDYSKVPPRVYLYNGLGLEMLFAFLKSIFNFQNFIPISLYISMEMSRLMQSFMMTRDKSMCHEATGNKLQCRALNINEDLGQIKYVFSDKTGTLTENKMVFQCASIYGVDYNDGVPLSPGEIAPHPAIGVGGEVLRPKVIVDTDRKLLRLLETGRDTEAGLHALDFFLALAACNTVVPQVVDTSDPGVKSIDYQGESPDEQALVYAAAAYGFVLIEKSSAHITIDVLGERQRYSRKFWSYSVLPSLCRSLNFLGSCYCCSCRFEVLGLHEFDSDRKRMSAVICCPDKSIKIIC
ncbi:unnamed protein product [Musa textilis]